MNVPLAVAQADDNLQKIHEPWAGHDTQVLVVTVIGIAIVVLLIVLLKMHGFLALTIGSLFVGIGSGIGLSDVAVTFETGVGAVLGNVGVLIVLGAILGKLLADSGGADEVVDKFLSGRGGGLPLPWRMALIAFVIGIPMFFEIGLVLLIPVIMLVIRRSKMAAMSIGIPALAGLSVLHGFVPPHPGPLAAIANLNADIGVTLAFGLVISVPTVIIAGPLWAKVAARLVPIGAEGAGGGLLGGSAGGGVALRGSAGRGTTAGSDIGSGASSGAAAEAGPSAVATDTRDEAELPVRRPTFTLTLLTILSPVVLMLIRAAAEVWMSQDAAIYPFLMLIGEPLIALLIAVLLAMVTFGTSVGFSASTLTKKASDSLMPIVSATIIVGAGGGFKQVLVDGGTGIAIGKVAVALSLSTLVLGWIIAVLVRLATGSATVAIVTASGIVAPLASNLSTSHLSLVVLAIGAGSLFFSHVNDAGFWLVKEYFGMTVGQTLKTWSVMETIVAVVGLVLTFLLWQVF